MNTTTNDLLTNVTVASPCSARWGHMIGDERSRYCLQCKKHVYNFTAMTAAEITDLIRQKEGKLCARFYRRADGTMLTADCPMGTGRFWRAIRTRLTATAALFAITAAAAMAANSASQPPTTHPPSRFTQLWDTAKLKVKTWFGYKPQPKFVMGDICVPPPAAKPSPPSS